MNLTAVKPELQEKIKFLHEKRSTTMTSWMGIEYTSFDYDKVTAEMEVTDRVKQPFGLLHGGASVALAESLASIGAWLNVDDSQFAVVGIEINANHLQSLTSGKVFGSATPIHRGRSTHVWEVRITDANNKLVSISRCTLAVISKQKQGT